MSSPKFRVPNGATAFSESQELVKPDRGGGFRKDEGEKAIPGLLGKKVVFVTDDRDLNIERVVTNIVMESAGAGAQSRPIGYSDFFSSPQHADILILRSSRVFSLQTDALLASLEQFRKENPRSAVIVCSFEFHILQRLQPLEDAGVINSIESRVTIDDNALLRLGACAYQKLQAL